MQVFKDDKEALEFLAKFVSSDTWKWFEEIIKIRHETILKELSSPKTTADGRAMLTGRLIETKYFLDFPVRSFDYYKGMEAAQKTENAQATKTQREAIVSKHAFPDIVTH